MHSKSTRSGWYESVGQAAKLRVDGSDANNFPRNDIIVIKPVSNASRLPTAVSTHWYLSERDDVDHEARAAVADGGTKPSRGTGVRSAKLQTELVRARSGGDPAASPVLPNWDSTRFTGCRIPVI